MVQPLGVSARIESVVLQPPNRYRQGLRAVDEGGWNYNDQQSHSVTCIINACPAFTRTRYINSSQGLSMGADIRLFRQYDRLRFGNEHRRVHLYSLKERGRPGDIVIYCSDGQGAGAFALNFFNAYGLANFWFVGVDASSDCRNAEYVIDRDESRFAVHESFFVNIVVDWATAKIGIPHAREESVVFGYSCGGAFAASMGIRHPDVFRTIFAFSIAGRPVSRFDAQPNSVSPDIRFFMRAGSREPSGMHSYMKRLEDWLRSANAQTNNETLHGGHDFALWSRALNETILLAFAPPLETDEKNYEPLRLQIGGVSIWRLLK